MLTACNPNNVVYSRYVGYPKSNLYVIREDGTGFIPLITTSDINIPCGVASENRLVFNKTNDLEAWNNALGNTDIYTVTTDGTKLRPVRNSPERETCFGVSTNDWVIFQAPRTFRVFQYTFVSNDLFSTHVSFDAGQAAAVLSATPYNERPLAISKSGRLVFERNRTIYDLTSLDYDLFSINVNGGGLVQLSAALPTNPPTQPFFKAMTPNDRVIYNHSQSPLGLYSVNIDGTGHVNLTSPLTNSYRAGAFAVFCGVNDKNQIAFTIKYTSSINMEPQKRGTIYVVNSDGTDLHRVSKSVAGYDDICNAILTDNWVIFTRHYSTSDELYSIRADGTGQEVVLAKSPGQSFQYERFSPGSRRIIYSHNNWKVGVHQLYSIFPDASHQTQIVSASSSVRSVGVTVFGRVIYQQWDNNQSDLFSIMPDGNHSSIPLANSPDPEYLSLIY